MGLSRIVTEVFDEWRVEPGRVIDHGDSAVEDAAAAIGIEPPADL